MTQPLQTELARKWKWEVNTGTVATPAWTNVNGLNEFSLQPHQANLEDDNAYEDGGWTSKTKTALSWSGEGKLLRRKDATTNVLDVGQEKVRTCARAFENEGWLHCRIYDRNGGPEAYEGFAEVEWNAEGGSTTDLETVTVALSGKGELDIITNPAA